MEPKPVFRCALARLTFATFLCLAFAGTIQTATALNEKVLVEVKINGQPARLAFDTGSGHSVLFRAGAARLGIKATDSQAGGPGRPGEIWAPASEPFALTLGDQVVTTSFGVLDSALPMPFDGVLAWGDVRSNIVLISGQRQSVTLLSRVPDDVKQWPHWKLVDAAGNEMASQWLGFQVRTNRRSRSAIYLDTGSDEGVRLCSKLFQAWHATNPAAPVSLMAHYYPGLADGLVVREEYWAKRLDLGGALELSDVPLSRCTDSEDAMDSYEAALGLYALTRLDVVVDGVGGEIYIQPAAAPTNAWNYDYNRIGALFAPRDIRGGDLVATVLTNSPAYAAGVRDGDVLTRIGDLDATQWRTDPRILPLSRFWSQPAGTKINITCRRGDTNVDLTVQLKEIFPQGPATAKPALEKSNTP
jgi:hypothetical protein